MSPREILRQYWGYESFRPLQEEIVESVLEGKDTLALMPTGGGKSITFQVPALCREGLSLVITPLIALMKDQVENLQKREIPAAAIYSGMSYREIDITLDNAVAGKLKFLYLSPERLETDIFLARLPKMNVSQIAVDESHCISQWGYDFRPAYLKIAKIREIVPDVPIIAVTATATTKVVEDIQEKLEFREKNVFQKSFERENLAYVVLKEEGKYQRLLKILNKVPGTSVVYVRNRRKTKEVADFLRKNRISADFYHAGIINEEKERKQKAWTNGHIRVIVATNAFGMGIDKPDVRTVVHLDLADSLEAYFQEAGRAGRDGKKAYAVLLYNDADVLSFEKRLEEHFPEIDEIVNVYDALGSYLQLAFGAGEMVSFDFDIARFCKQYDFKAARTYQALKLLEQQEWIALTEPSDHFSRLKIAISSQDIYRFEVENQKFEPLIKTLLRSYGGLYDEFVKIREVVIARQLKTTEDTIIKALQFLDKNGIVYYRLRKKQPQVTYLKARVDKRDLNLDRQFLQERKENYETKLKAVLNYASVNEGCRSLVLLNYFGEAKTKRCGVCDLCLERNKLEMSSLEFESIKEALHKALEEAPVSISEITEKLKQFSADKVLKAVEWLLDHEKISKTPDNKLIWEANKA